MLLCLSPVIQSLSVDQLYKGQLAEFPANLDSFYTGITSDYIGMEARGSGEPYSDGCFPMHKLNTARWSHLTTVWVLDITKLANLMAKLSGQLCGDFQPDGCLSSHTTVI